MSTPIYSNDCAHTHTHTHTYTHTYKHTHIHTHIYTYTQHKALVSGSLFLCFPLSKIATLALHSSQPDSLLLVHNKGHS